MKKYGSDKVKCNKCIRATRSHEMKVKCVKYLGGKCVDCRGVFPEVVYDFDHKNNGIDKQFKISGAYVYRWKELRRELDKTELRCANCHRLRHWVEKYGDK